jgi:hypothetical protein
VVARYRNARGGAAPRPERSTVEIRQDAQRAERRRARVDADRGGPRLLHAVVGAHGVAVALMQLVDEVVVVRVRTAWSPSGRVVASTRPIAK